MKLPVSVMIVGYNEAGHLRRCLDSVSFCDEIIYTDLGSTDNSVSIANEYTDRILSRPKVPSCEMIQAEVVHLTKHEWVIFIDPDEEVSFSLQQEVINRFEEIRLNSDIGAVMVPWQFYFKGKRLAGTVWGGKNSKYFLVNRNKFIFEPVVHYGRKLAPGYKSMNLDDDTKELVLHHFWMSSYRQLVRKHKRYLKNEGTDNYNLGVRTGRKQLLLSPCAEFGRSFFTLKGYRDGFKGFFLSAFWAWYRTRILIDLYRIQQSKKAAAPAPVKNNASLQS